MPRLLAAAVLALLIALPIGAPARADIRVVEMDKPVDLPAFTLTDHKGKPFTAASYKGHWALTMIGYTYCPDVCPFVLNNLAGVITQLSTRVRPDHLPQVVFVAVDPKRDKANLADYVSSFGPQFLGATGEKSAIDTFVKGIDGFYKLGKPDKDGNYVVNHSASVIVTAPDGRIHAKLSPPLNAGEIAEYLARQQIAYNRKQGN